MRSVNIGGIFVAVRTAKIHPASGFAVRFIAGLTALSPIAMPKVVINSSSLAPGAGFGTGSGNFISPIFGDRPFSGACSPPTLQFVE
jgi:hypothetical protein